MATKQIDGSAVTVTSTRNNRGVVMNGGTIADNLLVGRNLGTAFNDSAYLVAQSTSTGAGKIVSAGTFGVLTAEKYVIRRVTSELAGVANTVLLSGGSDFGNRHAIHKIEHSRNTFLKTLSWDVTSSEAPVYTLTVSNTAVTFNNDEAARPTLAVPGELVYRSGGPTVNLADYPEKTNG